jgi:hypothetical protein
MSHAIDMHSDILGASSRQTLDLPVALALVRINRGS